jgi:alanine dehydrogenase
MITKKIGLIKEGKIPADNRVALTPAQCKLIHQQYEGVQIIAEHSKDRCFSDAEYKRAGVDLVNDMSDCEILIGIKEIPVEQLIANKTYLFFSHTKKKQTHNQKLLQSVIKRKITLIDFECLEHEDGQRIIGFGFFAGIVGAHNGMMAYGNRTGAYQLDRVHNHKTFRKLLHTYFGLKLPNVKIAVTGSGRVAQGILEVMNLMQIRQVEKEEYLERDFSYPVYIHLKGSDLYAHKKDGSYSRAHFHKYSRQYKSIFSPYLTTTDILMNGVYWDQHIPRLFQKSDVAHSSFRIQVIADVTDDKNGSIPINKGDQKIENPVYGIDKKTLQKTAPYLSGSIDIMAVGNLPNELPRDASRYFGEQMIKHVLPNLFSGDSDVLKRATIVENGVLTEPYQYLQDYANGE